MCHRTIGESLTDLDIARLEPCTLLLGRGCMSHEQDSIPQIQSNQMTKESSGFGGFRITSTILFTVTPR